VNAQEICAATSGRAEGGLFSPPDRERIAGEDKSRHDERPDPVGEVNRHRKGGERRHEAPERQGKIGNREARLRVAHDRADDELEKDHRDRRGADPRDASPQGAVRVAPARGRHDGERHDQAENVCARHAWAT
jgi:hypothetical protein